MLPASIYSNQPIIIQSQLSPLFAARAQALGLNFLTDPVLTRVSSLVKSADTLQRVTNRRPRVRSKVVEERLIAQQLERKLTIP